MRRLLSLGLLALALPAAAARLTITSYGVPHSYPLDPTDQITFDATGLVMSVHSVSLDGKPSTRTFYLGYSNKVVVDATDGALKNLFVATTDSGVKTQDLSKLDSLVFRPALDETGDEDGDGLTNLQELLVYHTDPRKKDTDGDGIDDYTETTWDPKVYSPLVANLPDVQVELSRTPGITFNVARSNSQSEQVSATKSTSWGTENGRSTSRSVMNSEQFAAGISVTTATEENATLFAFGVAFNTSVEVRCDVTQSHEVTNQWSYDQRSSFSQGLEEAKTKAIERGTQVTGATVTVPIVISNVGDVGVQLNNPQFTLYGISYYNGQPIETALLTLTPPSSAISLERGASTPEIVLDKLNLTLAQAEALQAVTGFVVRRTGGTLSYTVQSPKAGGSPVSLVSTDVNTSVGATTARVEVDFDNALAKQESPMVRQVAVLNKPDIASGSYAPTYLGELLADMGLTYHFDSLGFVDINGLTRNATNAWAAIKMTAHGGGKGYDTAVFSFKGKAGPDSVVVGAGDYVLIGYSGDDDKDGVPNIVEKFYGIFDKPAKDYDGDGLSDSAEIYGRWINKGTKDSAFVFTNPKARDTDGDGLSDLVDPFPLTPRMSSNSSVDSVALTDENAKVQTLKFPKGTLNVAAGSTLGASLKLKVFLDTLPRWCKVVLNKKGDTLVLSRDLADTSKIVFTNSVLPNFQVGSDTVEVIVRSLDGTVTKTWSFTGTSKPQISPSLLVSLERDATQGWKRKVTALLEVPGQAQVDPRTTGVLLLRSNSLIYPASSKLTPKASAPQLGSTIGDTRLTVVGSYTFSDGIASRHSIVDTSMIEGGKYYYIALPYILQNETYYFPDSSLLKADSVAIQKLLARPYLDNFTHVSGSIDGDNNAADLEFTMTYNSVKIFQTWEGKGGSTRYYVSNADSREWISVNPGGSLDVSVYICERESDSRCDQIEKGDGIYPEIRSGFSALETLLKAKNAPLNTILPAGNFGIDFTVCPAGVCFTYMTTLQLKLVEP